MTHAGDDLVATFRLDLWQLLEDVRSPTYRTLRDHAGFQGVELPTSTIGTLLNGPGFPKRATVEAFVLACRSYARAHRITIAEDRFDLTSWHARYSRIEAERANQADQGTPQLSTTRRIRPRLAVPRQLPPDVAGFSGRLEEIAELDRLLTTTPDSSDADSRNQAAVAAICAVSGTAGVGKTALAIHWAHRVTALFPDGQIYVDLRGFDPSGRVMNIGEAVRSILDALEVKPGQIPPDVEAQLRLYRRLINGRRMLLLLDNCQDAVHARPLLPSCSTVAVVVTSRDELSGLIITDGASPLMLELLTLPEARVMLARRLGARRVIADQQAADEIITYCARLPLALAIAAARAAIHPQFSLASLARELRDRRGRLDVLTGGDPSSDMRQVLSWSLGNVTPETGSLFALLSIHPGPDISAYAASSLAGQPEPKVRSLLSGLGRAHLASEGVPGRYSLHDLLRAYASDRAGRILAGELQAVVDRMLAHYLYTAHAAALLLNPYRKPLTLAPLPPGTNPEKLENYDGALNWFKAEHQVIMAVIQYSVKSERDLQTSQIAWTLATYLERDGHWRDQSIVQRLAIAATEKGDQNIRAAAYNYLGRACQNLGLLEEAGDYLRTSLDLYSNLGNSDSCAVLHLDLAVLSGVQGRYSDAVNHAREALDLGESTGNDMVKANALNSVGWFHAMLENYDQALRSCEQALSIEQAINNRDGQADTWDSLGYVYHHLRQHVKALECYENALELFRELGNRYYEANTLRHLAEVCYAVGNLNGSREALQLAIAILDDLDHPDAEQVHSRLLVLESEK